MFIRPMQLSEYEKKSILERFWKKDPSLWSGDPEVQKNVANRLGWLDVIPKTEAELDDVTAFVDQLRERGVKRVVLLGMGGSSLCPLVMSRIFGSRQGYPELVVLDTTDPEEFEKVCEQGEWASTLFVVASKSGTTVEPNALFKLFWGIMEKEVEKPASHFVAITDPDSPLDNLAQEMGFFKIFRNPPDIGGRYSALSLFGIVPAAILGIDVKTLLERAKDMISRCGPDVDLDQNPGWILGEFLGEYSAQSRDKLTILADPPVRDFGLWLEQLIAESTGKETRGIVPIVGETTGIPGFYGGERIFVYIRLKGTPEDDSLEGFINELRQAEFPVHEIWLEDLYDLGGQFFLWEMATAIASHCLDVNAFDEPDVSLAKEKTKEVLDKYRESGKFPVRFWVDPQSEIQFRPSEILASSHKGLLRCMRDMFQVLPTWGYMGFLPYLPYDPEVEQVIGEMRHMVRQEKGCATVLGFGPRYLHSTGQIHKGGPISSAFIIFTRKRPKDYPEVPGVGASLWHIQFAQAVGDFEALSQSRKRVIHVHLNQDYKLGLSSFFKVLSRAVRL